MHSSASSESRYRSLPVIKSDAASIYTPMASRGGFFISSFVASKVEGWSCWMPMLRYIKDRTMSTGWLVEGGRIEMIDAGLEFLAIISLWDKVKIRRNSAVLPVLMIRSASCWDGNRSWSFFWTFLKLEGSLGIVLEDGKFCVATVSALSFIYLIVSGTNSKIRMCLRDILLHYTSMGLFQTRDQGCW